MPLALSVSKAPPGLRQALNRYVRRLPKLWASAATLIGDAFLETVGCAGGIAGGGREVLEDVAQVDEMLLSGGALL